MKFLIVVFVASLAVLVKSDHEKLMKMVQDCKESVGATDEDLGKIIIRTKPENQQQKCMLLCMSKGMNIVS